MKLFDLFDNTSILPIENCEISAITDDSRKIEKNCIFVCIKGSSFDGHEFAKKALCDGAALVIVERDLGLERQLVVGDTRQYYGVLCAKWFSNPEKKLKLIGVTGTNGKTTVTGIIKHILTENGCKVGLIGTIQNEIGDEIIPAKNTTPLTFEFFSLLSKMVKAGCTHAVMEVSSFGLQQKRIGPASFGIGVFTNLTPDHLDYHNDMEDYYNAKKQLFQICDVAICNIDDAYGERLYNEINCNKYTFSNRKKADFYADAIRTNAAGSSFWFCTGDKSYFVNLHMPGLFNISNATAAMGACLKLGMPIEKIIEAASSYKGTKGRCEIIPTDKDFSVICDYAHTPDALENILAAIKTFTENRLICLFGCGGNRDKTKRPLMGNAASKYADLLIITSDNPRNEAPDEIINDIIEGIGECEFVRITDRKSAIYYALENAQSGDVIVLAGKGHEDYQVLANGEKIHFDEREIVAEGLSRL